MRWIVAAALLALPAAAAELKPETVAAFDRYIRADRAAAGRAQRTTLGRRVARPGAARPRRRNRRQPFHAKPLVDVKDGLIHDWVGAAFLPGVTLEQTLRWCRTTTSTKRYYRPEVVDSRILSHEGNRYRIFMRLLKKQVITVVLDTEHDVHYEQLDAKTWRSVSRTTRSPRSRNAGKPDEKVCRRERAKASSGG